MSDNSKFSFKDSVSRQLDDRVKATAPIEPVDAFVFCTSSKYLGERLFPWQSLTIKLYYGLWQKYPLSPEEQKLVDTLESEWHIKLDLENRDVNSYIEILILVTGRRAGKSSLISFVQTYEAYKLICKGDPQRFYGIRDRHPIQIVNCAKDGDQAKDPFLLVKNNIRRIPFFQKYIDTEKDNESEMRLFTPADLYENQQIEEYNRGRQRGSLKKGRIEGSILISAFTTSAAGKRGKAVICLVLDEYAHFDRAKMTGGGMTDEDILNEAPQTDYAMLKAIAPATKDFNLPDRGIYDGKIIMISSPKEKGGEFYNHYCLAGGMEQPNPYRDDIEPKYVMLQLSSWQANPRRNRESFDSDFKKDPIGSNMEYGSHFGEPSSAFVNPETVEAMIDPARKMCYFGEHGKQYVIALDPARKMDTYAIAWGHAEGHVYIVDGIHGFRPEIVRNPQTGMVFTAPIDPNKIVQFITSLVGALSAHGRVLEVCFDQFNSSESLNILRAMKVPAVETVFTTKYNGLIYSNLFEKLNTSCVRVFGDAPVGTPPGFPPYQSGWLEQLKLELKFLNRITTGDNVYYEAPSTGPVQTDDFCDALANLVHRLILYNSRDPRIMKEIAKQIGRPVKFGIRSAIQTGGPLFTNTGGAPGRRKLIAQVSERFRR